MSTNRDVTTFVISDKSIDFSYNEKDMPFQPGQKEHPGFFTLGVPSSLTVRIESSFFIASSVFAAPSETYTETFDKGVQGRGLRDGERGG